MKQTLKFSAAITACTLLLLSIAPLAMAGTPIQNTWAPEGDRVGLENHWALGFDALDSYGSATKTLEDWQLGEEYSGYGLFSYRRAFGPDRRLSLRGYGTNADGKDLTGRFVLQAGCIGKRTLTLKHRGYNFFSDDTSEQRNLTFAAGPVPDALDTETGMAWCRNDVDLRYHVTDRLDLSVGAMRSVRDGAKASLLRAATGSAVPGLKTFDTEIMEFRWGGALALGPFATDLRMSYRTAEGQRDLDDRHLTTDDQRLFTTRVGATYDIAPDTRLLGHFVNSKLENDGVEVLGSDSYLPGVEATTNAGGLSVVHALGSATLINASARFRSQTLETRSDLDGVTRQYADRDRTRQEYRIDVRHTGIQKTRLNGYYRFQSSELDGTTTAGANVLPGNVETGDFQTTVQEKTRQELGAKAQYRLGRNTRLKASLIWTDEDVNQTDTWQTTDNQPWYYWLGDRTTTQLNWRLALHTRPAKNFSLDLGHQMLDRDFELDGAGKAQTSWKSQRGFAAAYWRADDIFTLHFNASVGRDQAELVDGPETADSLSPVAYDGTTWRMAPGMVVQLSARLQLEAQYETVRFEDDGDDPTGLNKLSTDYDRTTVRARYRLLDRISTTASYRRYVFEENRWDDTINDIYSLALSGSF